MTQTCEPFFILNFIPFHTVHKWYIASKGYMQQYMDRGYTKNQIDYYGAITAMDAAVGVIRKTLQQYNVYNNTLLWFTRDNGPWKVAKSRIHSRVQGVENRAVRRRNSSPWHH